MSAGLLWLVTAIYLFVAVEQLHNGNQNMGIVYFGYAVANIGLIRGVS